MGGIFGEKDAEYLRRLGAIGVVPKRDPHAVLDQVTEALATMQLKAEAPIPQDLRFGNKASPVYGQHNRIRIVRNIVGRELRYVRLRRRVLAAIETHECRTRPRGRQIGQDPRMSLASTHRSVFAQSGKIHQEGFACSNPQHQNTRYHFELLQNRGLLKQGCA